MNTKEALVRELDRLGDTHRSLVNELGLRFLNDEIEKYRDTWIVPVAVAMKNGEASVLTDLLRTFRRSLEGALHEPVSVLLDPSFDDFL